MNELLAFLRGVVPRGKNAVKMADVRQVLGGNGFDDVRTWIQSGNIALRTDQDAKATAARIQSLLLAHYRRNAFLENKLGQVLTTGNGDTLRKMMDLLRSPHEHSRIELAPFPHLPNPAAAVLFGRGAC